MIWQLPNQPQNIDLVDYLIESRGIINREDFFNPTIEQLYDPFLLSDMKKCVAEIKNAVKKKKKIFIHGDFDVDGISATSIMWDFLSRKMKADVLPYIPSRFDQGYGLSESSIEDIISQGGELIITVDCGVKDMELVVKYKDKVDFIITDHHTLRTLVVGRLSLEKDQRSTTNDPLIPSALAVVHPLLSPDYPFKEICGAVVSWKVCSALNEELKLGIDMTEYLDLAAIGTICDIMPLIDENRAIVTLGLNQLRQTKNIGLKALMEVSGVKAEDISVYHVGFILGPRLNAAGRLESAMSAVRLLTTNSESFARKIALELNTLNQKRQDLTRELVEKAEVMVKKDLDKKVLFVYGDDWPEGIVGLIAGRLTEKYNRPSFVGSVKNGQLKGSARSIEVFNVANVLKELDPLLERHGGHAQAAGFSLKTENIENFVASLNKFAEEIIQDSDLEKVLKIDGLINSISIDISTVEDMNKLAPFGFGNPSPTLALTKVPIKRYQTLGNGGNHVKFFTGDQNIDLECIAFNFSEKFFKLIESSSNSLFDIAGSLDIDRWNGNEKIVMKVKDIRISE